MNTVVTSREAILDAGMKLVAEHGLGAINMRSVAQRCGVAVGSVYNYFPSKADLIAATVEKVWENIFHLTTDGKRPPDFIGCIQWIYFLIKQGSEDYPDFFSIHSANFTIVDKEKGRKVMEQYFVNIRKGLLQSLAEDNQVNKEVFDNNFTQEAFVSFVFSNILMLLTQGSEDCTMITEIVKRIIY